MKDKFLFLTKMSLKKKLGSKWFFLVNLLLALVIVALFNLNAIITFFGGDFEEKTKVFVIDQADTFDVFYTNIESIEHLSNTKEDTNITIEKTSKTEEKLKKEIAKNEIIVVLKEDAKEFLTAKVISMEKIDTVTYQILSQGLNSTKQMVGFEKLNIDPLMLSQISKNITLDRVLLSDERSVDENMDLVMTTVFPTVILPFFMLIIFLVQMVGGEICEEKTTKSMEIIISNVSPTTHLLSKMVASNLFVIFQGVLLVLYALLGLLISTSGKISLPSEVTSIWNSLVEAGFIDSLATLIPLALILMLLSFLAYSLIAGILASMTTNMEDFQQIQTPIMLILLAGYYLAIMAGMFEGSTLIKVLSYVPFLSCLVSPSLFMMGQIGIFDLLLSIVFLILFIVLLLKYGLKVYKIGILNYSSEKVWSRFLKALRSKEV